MALVATLGGLVLLAGIATLVEGWGGGGVAMVVVGAILLLIAFAMAKSRG